MSQQKKFGGAKFAIQAKAKKPAPPVVPTEHLPQTPEQLEQVLTAILAPDTAKVEAATKVMNAFLKHGPAVPALIQQIAQSTNPHARQMGAVLLRRVICKLWKDIKPQDQAEIKNVLLSRLVAEPERLVRHSIGVLISALAEQLVRKNQWPDLLDNLLRLCKDANENNREVAMMLFSALAENLTMTLKKFFNELFAIFSAGLSDTSVKVRIEALTALATLVDMLDEDEQDRIATFGTVIEPLIGVMNANSNNDDLLTAGFEVLDCLANSSTHVLDPYIPKITEFMCQITLNSHVALGVREKSSKLVNDLIRFRAHRLLKPNNLIPELLQVSFRLICEPFEDDDDEYITPQAMGIEFLDAILTNFHIAKKDVFPILMSKVAEYINSTNMEERKCALVIMAVMAEGCVTLVTDRLSELVPVACAAALPSPQNQAIKVRMNACIVIEQFADYLHPDISAYHGTILPCLLQILTNPNEHDMVKEKACSALNVFCEHLDSNIAQYITTIVPALLTCVQDPRAHVSQSGIQAIRAVASAAKELFEPYLNQCMQTIGVFLTHTQEEQLRGRCRATECIGALGAAVGKARFCQPMSEQPGQNFYDISFHMVMQSFQLEYFELRESAFLYFADMCEMMGHDFAPRLPMVLPLILATLFTDDGLEVAGPRSGFNQEGQSDDDETGDMDGDRDYSDPDDDDDDDDEKRHRVLITRSGALDEKISALHALTVIIPTVKHEDLRVYVKGSKDHDIFTAIWELSEYPHAQIRAANIQAMRELLCWFHVESPPQQGQDGQMHLSNAVEDLVKELVFCLIERMREDDDRQAAAEACDALGEVLEKFGQCVLNYKIGFVATDEKGKVHPKKNDMVEIQATQHLLDLLIRFLNEKSPAQQPEDGLDETELHEIEDHDFILMESVTDLIAIWAKVMGPAYEPGFKLMFPIMERFLRPEKQAPTKSMGIGAIAEVLHFLTPQPGKPNQPNGHVLEPYFPRLIQYAQQLLQDPSPQVRRNAAFLTGCLAFIPHPLILQQYPTFIQLLSGVYQPTTAPVDPAAGVVNGALKDEEFLGARDNACSAICKMLMTAPQATGISIPQFIELILSACPLQVDFEETKYVYPAILNLYRTHPAEIGPHTERVVSVFSQVFGNPDVDANVQKEMIAFCKQLVQQAPAEAQAMFAKLPQVQQAQFKKFIIDAP